MRPNALRQFLGKGNMVSDTLRDTIALCEEWYAAEPSIVTFVLLSLFHHLERRGWDNRQGVATAQYDPFKNMVLPHLIAIADLLIKAPAATPTAELDDLVIAYQASIKATP